MFYYKKNNEIKLKDYFNKYFEKQFRCEIFFLQKGLLFLDKFLTQILTKSSFSQKGNYRIC